MSFIIGAWLGMIFILFLMKFPPKKHKRAEPKEYPHRVIRLDSGPNNEV